MAFDAADQQEHGSGLARLFEGGRHCRLVPVGREHYEFLREIELTRLGPFWRSGGRLSSPEDFAARIWANCLVQVLVVGVPDGKALMWATCTSPDPSPTVASLSLARLSNARMSLRAASGVAAFVDYLFTVLSLRKIYIEVAEPNLQQFESIAGRLFMAEARLRDHHRIGDSYHDLLIFSLWADEWKRSKLRDHLLHRL